MPLTEQEAYWLGFLLADGCVYEAPGGRQKQLCVCLVDREHLEKLQTWLGGKINPHVEGDRWLYRLSSTEVCNWVGGFGVIPRKTSKETVDPRLQDNRDFWRGIMDGDGSVSFHWNRQKYKGKLYQYRVPYMSICGSKDVCSGLSTFLCWNKNPIKHKKAQCHSIRVEGRVIAGRACKTLYEGSSLFLDRKMNVAKEILHAFN